MSSGRLSGVKNNGKSLPSGPKRGRGHLQEMVVFERLLL